MISFANPYGSRVATLVVWGGEWEVQEGLGRASKPSPTLLAPAERVSPKLRIIVYSFQCFINILSLKQNTEQLPAAPQKITTPFADTAP